MATTTNIGKIATVADYIVGLGDHLIGAEVSDYSTAKLSDLVFKTVGQNVAGSVGDVLESSTSYDGEDVSTEEWKNEQGVAITSTVSGGSIGYSFKCQNLAPEMLKLLLGTSEISVTTPAWADGTSLKAQGFVEPHVIIRPFAILDETKKHFIIIPKAKISTVPGMDGKNQVLSVSVVAEKIDTADLKTWMCLPAAAKYETTT